MEDHQIVALLFAREESALGEIAQKYGSLCRRISANILGTGGDVEECVNDVWLNAWNSIPPQRPDSLRAYLGRLTRNGALDLFRQRVAQKRGGGMALPLSELEDCVPAPRGTEAEVDRHILGRTISTWLDTLPTEERRLFVRRYWLGEAVGDLARALGVLPNTLSAKLRRLRLSLKEHLETEGFTP